MLKQILDNQADLAARLVYADWLSENGGDPLRCEFIRAQVRARMEKKKERRRWVNESTRLMMLASNVIDWIWEGQCPFMMEPLIIRPPVVVFNGGNGHVTFLGGFIERLSVPQNSFLHTLRLFELHPILSATLQEARPEYRPGQPLPYWWRASGLMAGGEPSDLPLPVLDAMIGGNLTFGGAFEARCFGTVSAAWDALDRALLAVGQSHREGRK